MYGEIVPSFDGIRDICPSCLRDHQHCDCDPLLMVPAKRHGSIELAEDTTLGQRFVRVTVLVLLAFVSSGVTVGVIYYVGRLLW
jgi:hypothetical protein